MTRLRLPLRLARREVWRRPGRTVLVALLVALPVAAMTMAVVLIRTDRTPPSEQWEREVGQADAVLYGAAGGPGEVPIAPPGGEVLGGADPAQTADDLIDRLPPGSRVVTVSSSYHRVRTIDGYRADLDVRDLPLQDPLTAGIHDLVEGRAPQARGEVALGARLADQLHASVGRDLVLERPAVTLRVVGLIEPVGCLSCSTALVAPGEVTQIPGTPGVGQALLVDLPDDLTAIERSTLADQLDGHLVLREQRIDPRGGDGDGSAQPVRWSLVLGALVLTVAGIVISAAFAVGARRQLVTLGQLSASGVAPTTMRTALVLQGTVTGVLGAGVGLTVAGITLPLIEGRVERLLDERINGYTVRAVDVLLAVAIGIGAATAAALIPARTAARIPTLAALAGRRPLVPVSRRLISWGIAAMVGGLALLGLAVVGSQSGQSGELWAYVAILGGVGELLGASALAPALVARLEPLAGRLRGPWRIGARSLARHRSRTGAVVSAVAAAGALAIAAGGLVQGMQAQEGRSSDLPDDVVLAASVTYDEATGVRSLAPPPPELQSDVARLLGSSRRTTLRVALTPDGAHGGPEAAAWWEIRHPGEPEVVASGVERAVVADPGVLDLLRAGSDLRDALAQDGLVVLVNRSPSDQPVEVRAPNGMALEALELKSAHTLGFDSSLLITPQRAAELDLVLVDNGMAFTAAQPLTKKERDDVADLTFDLDRSGNSYTELRWHSPRSGPSPVAVELILTGLALAFSLFVVTVSLALAAAESKDERDVLTIGGAPPRLLARSAGARAWLLAGMGGAMAVPVGFLPVIVFTRAGRAGEFPGDFPLVFPSRTALVVVLLVPCVAGALAWAASSAAQMLRPVRVSTATFE